MQKAKFLVKVEFDNKKRCLFKKYFFGGFWQKCKVLYRQKTKNTRFCALKKSVKKIKKSVFILLTGLEVL